MIYYDIVVWVLKLFRVYRIIIMMMIFEHVYFIFFHKNVFHHFEDYLMMKLTLG
jgi:hypothetical protein